MTEPSKVIHVRNVGHEISENDLLQLVQPFGVVTKLVMLRAKNQALLQMHDVASAMNVIQYYTNVQPSVRGRNVYIQFSSHQELTTADQNSQGRKGDQDSPPNRILLATIHHMLYPITVEVLHQVFSPCGYVEKIVTFQKSAGFQALIQFDAQQSAVQARSSLQGRNIYDGCCQLDIQFSNLNELQVNYNNDRSRDFTNPSLPTDQRGRSSQQHGYGDAGSLYALQSSGGRAAFGQMGNAAAIAAAFGGGLPAGVTGTNDRSTILVTNLDPDKIDEDKLFNLFSMYGNIIRIKLLRNKPDHALVQMEDGFQAELAVHFLKGSLLFGKRLELNFSKYPSITPASDTHEYASSSLNRFNNNAVKNYKYCCSPTKMIHLSSLPQDITEEEILSHLEEHGTVVNTKLFEVNGKKQALVLFEDEAQATEALVCKHASSIARSVIRISFSQLQSI
ncbi:polypyrimidine tract-binding protein homolog 3-like isoform X1 [Zingiber officinale]|uniref:polypyrimidine tract-binding protein homolog 3-like isoform X1 n=1 Tax=Zingiber officinale TaxID=94328 RepID=UPI001C4AF46E|nr:polypyrimidine tract-binding protein homolog 3-like isoform X1 [Zingiber officinale]XP_042395511.1 polypyrimidine tract-binding protein homolog 3-like isoform X1 [Zingiber officinale]